jgi:hypothetical protein
MALSLRDALPCNSLDYNSLSIRPSPIPPIQTLLPQLKKIYQRDKIGYRMGENFCQLFICQGINIQNT